VGRGKLVKRGGGRGRGARVGGAKRGKGGLGREEVGG